MVDIGAVGCLFLFVGDNVLAYVTKVRSNKIGVRTGAFSVRISTS